MNMDYLKAQINSMKACAKPNVISARLTLDDYFGDGCKYLDLMGDMDVLVDFRDKITRLLDKIDDVCSSVVTPEQEQEALEIYEKEFSPGGLNSIRLDIIRLLSNIQDIVSYPKSAMDCTGVLKKKSDSPVSSGGSVASNESSIGGTQRKMEHDSSSIKVQANVLLEVPPGFEQSPQSYLDAPPGFEVAVTSTSQLSSAPTKLLPHRRRSINTVQARDQGSFGVQDGGMSLNFVGREGLSEKASSMSMPISRGSNVMEGRKKYGIFRRPTVRDTGVARSGSCKSNVRGNGVVRSCSSAWVTVSHESDRGPHTYTLFAPFIIIVFDGGGNISSIIVILGGVMNMEHKAFRGSTVLYPMEVNSLSPRECGDSSATRHQQSSRRKNEG